MKKSDVVTLLENKFSGLSSADALKQLQEWSINAIPADVRHVFYVLGALQTVQLYHQKGAPANDAFDRIIEVFRMSPVGIDGTDAEQMALIIRCVPDIELYVRDCITK